MDTSNVLNLKFDDGHVVGSAKLKFAMLRVGQREKTNNALTYPFMDDFCYVSYI